MKKIYILFAFLFASSLSFAQVDVTFQVDMSEQTVSDDGVYVTGNWMDDAGLGGEWQAPGTNEDAQLSDGGDGIYTLTVTMEPGTYEYKYANGDGFANAEAGGDQDNYQADLSACSGVDNGFGGYNRVMIVPNDGLTLDAYLFNSCEIASTSVFEPTSTLKGMQVMPNPVTERAVVLLDNPTSAEHDLILTNSSGQVVKLVTGVIDSYELQRDDLPRGMYFLTLRNERGEVSSRKVLIR